MIQQYIKRIISIALMITIVITLSACNNNTKLIYKDGILTDGTIDSEYNDTVATAAGVSGIKYYLDVTSVLPTGLILSDDGTISGIPTEITVNHSFIIIASVEDSEDVSAEFSITVGTAPVILDTISFTGTTLDNGNVNSSYSISVADATGTTGIEYTLKSGNGIPEGLILSSSGVISGIPTTTVTNFIITVIASSDNALSVEASFILTIDEEDNTLILDTITYFGTTLLLGQVNEEYSDTINLATGTQGILYTLKSGSSLPSGLLLSGDGSLYGTPIVGVSEYTFTVIATASNATPAEAVFTISITSAPTTYIFESELVDIDDLEGGGISGAPGTPLDMIISSANASGGYYLGFTHRTGLSISYKITSDINTTSSMTLHLGSEIGSMLIDASVLDIKVNGLSISFSEFTIPENSSYSQEFTDFMLSSDITLQKGENTISITVVENEYLNGTTGAPMYDSISLFTTATLTWVPKTSNLE